MGIDLDAYKTVPERIVEFREKYPDGRLRQKSLEFVRDFASKDWVVYTAQAWRTPDDPSPAEGTAWEPVPGPTLFTRDSEVQNAETAAWGRAIVAALAADTTKGVASAEEVRNRQVTPETKAAVDPVLRDEWVSALNSAETLAGLEEAWEGAGKAGVTSDPTVIKVKDKRKAELS